MGIAEGEVEDLALEVGLESDALDLEILGIPGGHALHHAGDDRARRAVHGVGKTGWSRRPPSTITFLSVTRDLHHGGEGLGHLALGALDPDGRFLDVDLYLVGNGNGLFADAAHGGGGSLPNVADQFAPRLLAAAVGVLHQALRGRDDRDSESVQHPGNLGVAVVKAAAGRRDAGQAGQDGRRRPTYFILPTRVLWPRRRRRRAAIADVALVALRMAAMALLEPGMRHDAFVQARLAGVAQTG